MIFDSLARPAVSKSTKILIINLVTLRVYCGDGLFCLQVKFVWFEVEFIFAACPGDIDVVAWLSEATCWTCWKGLVFLSAV